MKTSWIFLSLSIMLIIISGCEAQEVPDTNPTPSIMSEAYEPCCGMDTVTYRLGKEWIAMPNVFTPNGDGVNDLFYPIVSNDSIIVYHFNIWGVDTLGNKRLLYGRQSFTHGNLEFFGWNGIRYNVDSDKKPHRGIFGYSFNAYLNDVNIVVEGTACAIICDEEAPIFRDKDGCFFQSQLTSTGDFDNKLPKMESGCFE